MSDEAKTAREHAETSLAKVQKYRARSDGTLGVAPAVAWSGKRIGWSLLAVADSISDLAAAYRERTAVMEADKGVYVTRDPETH